MKLGIVGSEAAKFTLDTELKARTEIIELFAFYKPELVISGGCHLGGIDSWAIGEAKFLGIPTKEYLAKTLNWEGGYKDRNLLIAKDSDVVVCITVKKLPPGYSGMRFRLCYHCGTTDHVKSGGCWTVKQAIKRKKVGEIIVI